MTKPDQSRSGVPTFGGNQHGALGSESNDLTEPLPILTTRRVSRHTPDRRSGTLSVGCVDLDLDFRSEIRRPLRRVLKHYIGEKAAGDIDKSKDKKKEERDRYHRFSVRRTSMRKADS
jgi:hypothetical protein